MDDTVNKSFIKKKKTGRKKKLYSKRNSKRVR